MELSERFSPKYLDAGSSARVECSAVDQPTKDEEMIRIATLVALVLNLCAVSLPLSAAAEPLIQAVTVTVNPGKLDQYRQELKKIRAIQTRLGSKGTMRVWNVTSGGADAGQVLVGLEYPDAASWAADSGKMQADAEWQKVQAGLVGIRTVVSNSIWRDISPTASTAAAGPTMVITGIEAKPGKLADYLKAVASASPINDRLKSGGRLRVWQADLAGEEAGDVVVGIEYADTAAYVVGQEKLAADSEWQKIRASLDELRTVSGRWLYQEITF
jgi:hypothetical protein